jgi:hypothetical protein
MGAIMPEGLCAWPGCKAAAEAALDSRTWCRTHFHDAAAKRVKEYEARLHKGEPTQTERSAITKSFSELMSQATKLIASAKSLSTTQREQFLAVSFSAMELYKQFQREPRAPRNPPIPVYLEENAGGTRELANALNLSKLGACIATNRASKAGETIWIQKTQSPLKVFARIVWVKRGAASQYLLGIEILDCENFWESEDTSPSVC